MVSFLFLNDDLKKSFQAGVDTLYNKCVSLGFTPAGKTPTDIADTIAKIYTDRYNSGYNTGYNAGYGAGRTQGQNDVKANPAAYGISGGFYWNPSGSGSGEHRQYINLSAGTHRITGVSMRYGNHQPTVELYYNGTRIFNYKANGGDQDISGYNGNFNMPAAGQCTVLVKGVGSNTGMTYLTITII